MNRDSSKPRRRVRVNDIAMAAGMIAIPALMIFPVSSALLDVALCINLAFGVCLLAVATYVPRPGHLPVIPSLILLATLYRLSLNVASTRLILTEGEAGEVIEYFGTQATSGSLLVGFVVFLVLLTVQFVLAKGSERMAEVVARFALDALPQKQMSLENEINNGLDAAEGRRRKAMLDTESQLFGTLVGAMKYVKGDAVAGIIIVLVNLIGGLYAGTARGRSLSEATAQLIPLTIGDGLVSQIPALLTGIAAAVIITRVSKEGATNHLGEDIFEQVTSAPKALIITGIFLAGLACTSPTTGLPAVPLGTLALACLWLGVRSKIRTTTHAESKDMVSPGVAEVSNLGGRATEGGMLAIVYHSGLRSVFEPAPVFEAALKTKTNEAAHKLGLGSIPTRVQEDDRRAGVNGYIITLGGDELDAGSIDPKSVLAIASSEKLASLGFVATAFLNGTKIPAALVSESDQLRTQFPDVRIYTPRDAILAHMNQLILRHASELLTSSAVGCLLEDARKSSPDLVGSVSPHLYSAFEITAVLRRLLALGISVRPLTRILQAMAEFHGLKQQGGLDAVADAARDSVRRTTCQILSRNHVLRGYVLDDALQQSLLYQIRTARDFSLPRNDMKPSILVNLIDQAIRWDLHLHDRPILFVPMELRADVARAVRLLIPDLVVMADDELVDPFKREIVGRVAASNSSLEAASFPGPIPSSSATPGAVHGLHQEHQ